MKSLIIQTAYLGDLILTEPLVRTVREKYGEIPYLLVRKGLEEILRFMGEVIPISLEKNGLKIRNTFSVCRKVARENFDLVLSPHRSFRSALIAKNAKNAFRVGFDKSGGFWFYDVLVPYEGEHEVKRILSLLKPVDGGKIETIPPSFITGEEDLEKGRRLLKSFGISESFIALFPGSRWETKRWLPEGFTGVIELLKRDGLQPVIMGSKEEFELCERIAERGGTVNLAGKTSLEELVLILLHARAIISNDSSPVHIASALKKPVVAIFGPTHPSLGFYPLSPKSRVVQVEGLKCRPCSFHGPRKCPEGHFLCMRGISHFDVYSALTTLL